MFRKLFPWFITLFMALVDTSVVPFLTNSPFTPLFSLTTIVALGLLLGGQVLGVGVGTLASMLLTGRVIAGINRAFRQPMRRLAGLEPAGTGEPSAL